MNKSFLLTYSFENTEGMHDTDYAWFETEQELRDKIEFCKYFYTDFQINEIIEIVNAREIEL